MESTQYPKTVAGSVKVQNHYDSNGFLDYTQNADTGTKYQTLLETSAYGHASLVLLGKII